MSKLMLITILLIGYTLVAHTRNSNAEGGNAFASIEAIDPTQQARLEGDSGVPIDGIDRLRAHSPRFEKAIRLIEIEAAKPKWGWNDGCGHLEHHEEQKVSQ